MDELQELKNNAAIREREISRLTSENVRLAAQLREAEAKINGRTKKAFEKELGHKIQTETEKMKLSQL